MAQLNGGFRRVYNKMKADGRIVELSKEETTKIDNNLIKGQKKAKSEFEVKEKNSRAYAAQMELASFSR